MLEMSSPWGYDTSLWQRIQEFYDTRYKGDMVSYLDAFCEEFCVNQQEAIRFNQDITRRITINLPGKTKDDPYALYKERVLDRR